MLYAREGGGYSESQGHRLYCGLVLLRLGGRTDVKLKNLIKSMQNLPLPVVLGAYRVSSLRPERADTTLENADGLLTTWRHRRLGTSATWQFWFRHKCPKCRMCSCSSLSYNQATTKLQLTQVVDKLRLVSNLRTTPASTHHGLLDSWLCQKHAAICGCRAKYGQDHARANLVPGSSRFSLMYVNTDLVRTK